MGKLFLVSEVPLYRAYSIRRTHNMRTHTKTEMWTLIV